MIPLFKVAMSHTSKESVAKVLASGMIGEGPVTQQFQRSLAELFHHEHVIPLSSCTAALSLALRLAGVGPGDEVITSPFTMVATSAAIKQAGATIRWCDVDRETLCADLDDIKEVFEPGLTRAILITCVGGLVPRGLEELAGLEIPVILDCAHALTTTYRDKHISHWGDYCCFSFQSIKPLTTGDGGALTVRDSGSADRAEKLKWFGISRNALPGVSRLRHQMTADIEEWGYKYHMNDIAASIGLSNFELALSNIQISRQSSEYYLSELKGLDVVETMVPPADCEPDWWLFGMLVRERDRLLKFLADHGVTASTMWVRNDHYSAFKGEATRPLPSLDRIMEEVIFIPNGFWLSEADREKIISAVKAFY